MQFNSYEFILLFLPATVLLYFTANRIHLNLGKTVLIAASILFYCLGRWNMLLYLGASIVLNYLFVLVIKKNGTHSRWTLAVPVVINVGLLLYFKYLNFAIMNVNALAGTDFAPKDVVLPLGISFYTFQQIAYVVATWRGELENSSLLDYLTYILYFPKLVMGPLAEPVDFITQINQPDRKKVQAHNIAVGLKLFSLGLIKKVLIADTFSRAAGWAHGNLNEATAMDCLLWIMFYTFEIYFDFSGYSDMATGISAMMNIDLPINFDSPYQAISIRDFWKRWHISLTRFLTKYIYIPLGGSRKGKAFTYLNVMIVFLVSGLWHGASWGFVAWGLLHGLLSCFDRIFEKPQAKIWKPIRWLFTFAAVSVLWLLFDVADVRVWLIILLRILHMPNAAVSEEMILAFQSSESGFLFNLLHINIPWLPMLVFILAACFICFIPENNYRNKDKLSAGNMILAAVCFIWGVLCLGAESSFVYFGF